VGVVVVWVGSFNPNNHTSAENCVSSDKIYLALSVWTWFVANPNLNTKMADNSIRVRKLVGWESTGLLFTSYLNQQIRMASPARLESE
jgi:hypothetical protein